MIFLEVLLGVLAAVGLGFLLALLKFAVDDMRATHAANRSQPMTIGPSSNGTQPAPEETFEVNMMEPLVGWKSWPALEEKKGRLFSNHGYTLWEPDRALEATCQYRTHGPVVHDHCSCGIYAADEAAGTVGYGAIRAQVYGWGRYIRGNKGWRVQFAYPKSFHLTSDQANLIEALKKYHCPIFIDEPLRVFSPEEEGYETYNEVDGHRDSEAQGHRRAAQDSVAGEEGDSGSDPEED